METKPPQTEMRGPVVTARPLPAKPEFYTKRKMGERMDEIYTQIENHDGELYVDRLKTMFPQYTRSEITGAIKKLRASERIFKVPNTRPILYTTVKPIVVVEKVDDFDQDRGSWGKEQVLDIEELRTPEEVIDGKCDHAIIRSTVGYEVISKVELDDMPAVMRFLRILSENK
jgi:hypothetical protein